VTFVKVDCAACNHVALITPEALLRIGLSPAAKVLDLVTLTAWRRVRLMPDSAQARRGVADKEPGIAVWAAVDLLDPGLIGLRTERGVLFTIRRDDAVSGRAQSGDDPGS
jgi:hypothetical protein